MNNYLGKAAVEIGTLKALVKIGQISEMISQKEAFNLYGKSTVKRWINDNLIECVKGKGAKSPVKLSRIKLLILARSFS